MKNQNILEQTVLAAMVIDENCAYDYGLLNINDFTSKINKNIYQAIRSLVSQNKKVDYMTVYEETNQKVDITYLVSLNDSLPTTANFKQYVESLKDLTLRREIKKLAADMTNKNLKGEEAADLAEQRIFDLRESTSTSQFSEVTEVVLESYAGLEDIYAGKKALGLSTGYSKIDRILGKLRKGEMILLGGRPAMGKTTLGINISSNVSLQGHKVSIFSLEMTKEQLMQRMIMSQALVDMGKIRKDDGKIMTENDWKKIQQASNALHNTDIFIDDDPRRTVAEMQSMCMKLKREEGLDLVVVDYLQKIRTSKPSANKREQIDQISNDLKNMAKILDIPVIVISSLSRANETRANKEPQMSDLRESGQLEYDADVVMFVHREYVYDLENIDLKEQADIIVEKNRNGDIGRTSLIWKQEFTRFLNPQY